MQICIPGQRFPAGAGNPLMVEAGGQHIRGFRCGLDYAFIHDAQPRRMDAERVIQSSLSAGS
jgi:hypothetical protein